MSNPMTGAEFKTIRESLGLSAQAVARFLGLAGDRTVRYWEAGRDSRALPVRIPAGAAAELLALERRAAVLAAALAEAARRRQPPTLARYRAEADLLAAVADPFFADLAARGPGLALSVHGAAVARARELLGRDVAVTWSGDSDNVT